MIKVVDFDDLYLDPANGLNWLYYIKGKYPNFKCSFFVVPGRTPERWLDEVKKPWIEFCLHGKNHDEKESITQADLDSWHYTEIYKGPNWKVDYFEMELLKKNDYAMAVKEKIDFPIRQWSLEDERCIHGHTWTETDWKKLENVGNVEFKFISEVL